MLIALLSALMTGGLLREFPRIYIQGTLATRVKQGSARAWHERWQMHGTSKLVPQPQTSDGYDSPP